MKSGILSLSLVAMASAQSFAQNKSLRDEVFTEKPRVDWVQTLLGILEGGAAFALLPDEFKAQVITTPQLDSAKQILTEASESLKEAQKLLSESEKAKLVQSLTDDFTRLSELRIKLRSDATNSLIDELDESSRKLTEAIRREVVTDAYKVAQIDEAAKAVTEARARVIIATDSLPKLGATTRGPSLAQKGVRLLRYFGATVFVVDAGSRVYIWHALEKDPTISPIATFAWSKGVNAWESYLDAVARGEKSQTEEKPQVEEKK